MYLVLTTTGGIGKECLMYHSHSTANCHQKRGAVCQNHLLDQNQNLMHTLEI